MKPTLFRFRTCLFLHASLALVITAQAQMDATSGGMAGGQKTCAELREELSLVFKQAYESKIPATLLQQLLPSWTEFSLPPHCPKESQTATFNPSSPQDQGGPLGTLEWPGPVITKGGRTRRKREAHYDQIAELNPDLTRDKRSTAEDLDNLIVEELARNKRSTSESDVSSQTESQTPLSRQRRFLNGMTFGKIRPTGSPREVSESAQMMKTLLLMSRYQKNRLNREYSQIGPNGDGFYGDRVSFGSGMYGDPYPGRRKREAPVEENTVTDVHQETQTRKKRFILPSAEPGERPPSMLEIMMGTARDPNTGKKIEFGGDYMKNAMRNSFMAVLPPSAQSPPGKEPSDFVKNMAPLWHFSRMQQMMSPMPRSIMKDPGDYPMMRSTAPLQRRNRDGYFGDKFPGKKRRKRSSDDNSDSSSSPTDVISFGDVTVPLDFFRPPEQADPPPPPEPLPLPPRPLPHTTRPRVPARHPFPPAHPPPSRYYMAALLRLVQYLERAQAIPPRRPAPYRRAFPPTTPRQISYGLAARNPAFPAPPPAAARPLGRKKRAADGNSNNDVVTIGDVSIPLDYFKPRDYSDDRPKYHRPQIYQPPPQQPRYTPRYTAPRHYPIQRQQQQQQHQQQVYATLVNMIYRLAAINKRYQNYYTAQRQPVTPVNNRWTPPVPHYQPPPPQHRPPPAPIVSPTPHTQTLPPHHPLPPHSQPPAPIPPVTNPYDPFISRPPPPGPPPQTAAAIGDPFIHPPPALSHSPAPRRVKRSDTSKGDKNEHFFGGNFFPLVSPFRFGRPASPAFPFFANTFSRISRPGYVSGQGRIFYGDPVPWRRRSSGPLLSRAG